MNTTISKALVVTLLGMLPLSAHALRGAAAVVTCSSGGKQMVRLLDFYEGQNLERLRFVESNKDPKVQITEALRKIDFDPVYHAQISNFVEEILTLIKKLPSHIEIQAPSDAEKIHATLPVGCRLATLGYYEADKLFTQADLSERLGPTQWAAFVVHEAVRYLHQLYGAPDSSSARRVVAHLFATNGSVELIRDISAPWSPRKIAHWNQDALRPSSNKLVGSGKLWTYFVMPEARLSVRATTFFEGEKISETSHPRWLRCVWGPIERAPVDKMQKAVTLRTEWSPKFRKHVFQMPEGCGVLNIGEKLYDGLSDEVLIELFEGDELLLSHRFKKDPQDSESEALMSFSLHVLKP